MPYKNYPTRCFETLRELLQSSAARFGQKPLFWESVGNAPTGVTYQEFAQRVKALGTALWARGIKDKRIVLCGKNGVAWATAFMTGACGLGVVIPVDHSLSLDAILARVEESDAEVVVASAHRIKAIAARCPALTCIAFEDLPILITEGKVRLAQGEGAYLTAPIDPHAEAVVFYTRDTSGKARGAMLSHYNLCFNLSEMCRMVKIFSEDVFLSVLPMHHAYECTCGFLCPLYQGASIAFGSDLRHLPREMRLFRPSVMLCVPALMETLYERLWADLRKQGLAKKIRASIKATNAITAKNLRLTAKRKTFAELHAFFGGRLRLLISGGSEGDPDVMAGFRSFGVLALQGYGRSECAPLITLNRDRFFNDFSVGLATPNTLLDIYEAQDDGKGEIRFQGENVMLGYYKDPKASAAVLRDGWFYTGDLGYIDENGFLFVTGKKKNLVVAPDGKSICPEELEGLLNERPYVKESVVMLGQHHKKDRPAVVAVVVPDYDRIMQAYGRGFTTTDIKREMRRALAEVNANLQDGKLIESYLLRTEPLPRNSAKRILRAEVLKNPLGE